VAVIILYNPEFINYYFQYLIQRKVIKYIIRSNTEFIPLVKYVEEVCNVD